MKPTLTLAAAAMVLAASVAFAQPPQGSPAAPPVKQEPPRPAGTPPAWRNLQYLPQTVSREQLMGTMRFLSESLGVDCSHCHMPGNFASDAMPAKIKAREMARMTDRINAELLPPILGPAQPGPPRVTCYSCHQGQLVPARRREAPSPAPGQ